MNYREVTGRGGVTLAALMAAAMSACAFFIGTQHPFSGSAGLCFPSVNIWGIPPLPSWLINLALSFGCAFGLTLLNKRYNFVPGSDTLLPAAFLIFTSSIPWMSDILTSSVILAAANLICLGILLSCFRSPNATRQIFIIATILSFGSMIQYAFIFMIPVYIISAVLLKCMRFREAMAMLMGLLAPYWMCIGLGIVSPDSLSPPNFTFLFDNITSKGGLFLSFVSIASVLLISLMLASQNLVQLYAGNSQRRLNTMCINILGFVCVICMLVDYNNITAYIFSAYITAAVSLSDFFALRHIPRPRLWLLGLLLYLTVLFVLIMIY